MCDSSKDDSGIFFVLGEIVNLVAKLSETDEKIVNKVCYLFDVNYYTCNASSWEAI